MSGETPHQRNRILIGAHGSGQTARWAVALRPRVLDWPAYPHSDTHQVAAMRRPRTEARAGDRMTQEGLTNRGPLQLGVSRVLLTASCRSPRIKPRPITNRWQASRSCGQFNFELESHSLAA